jgi:hypothetical protein
VPSAVRPPVAGPPEGVLAHVAPGADVIVPMVNGEPVGLVDTLEANHERLEDVRLHQMHALHERPYIHGKYAPHLRHVSYFLAPATREAYWNGGCDPSYPTTSPGCPRCRGAGGAALPGRRARPAAPTG